MQEPARTYFAPAERSSEEDLVFQIKLIAELPIVHNLFDSMPVMVALLNGNREIVFANLAFKKFLNNSNLSEYIGQRPGEAIGCLHSDDCSGGCGTSQACSVCGAVNAILISQQSGSANLECRITLKNGDALDLMIMTHQYKIGNVEFTIFSASDISSQNRRKSLERIFFHDLLNTTGALKGFIEMLSHAPENERDDYIRFSKNIIDHLIEEITAQKELTMAEDNELQLNISAFTSTELLKEVSALYAKHMVSLGKEIIISNGTDNCVITSDKGMMRRVLGNLVKNALEASDEKDKVILSCSVNNDHVEFSVWNKSIIPLSSKLQIFQRSFSTKGKGRGLGTYSVKLLTERYLMGKVWFETGIDTGTTFRVKYPLEIAQNN